MKVIKAIEFETDWYLIPNELYEEFTKLTNAWYDFEGTDFQYEIEDKLEKFEEYKTGGDLNLIQLYIE